MIGALKKALSKVWNFLKKFAKDFAYEYGQIPKQIPAVKVIGEAAISGVAFGLLGLAALTGVGVFAGALVGSIGASPIY